MHPLPEAGVWRVSGVYTYMQLVPSNPGRGLTVGKIAVDRTAQTLIDGSLFDRSLLATPTGK